MDGPLAAEAGSDDRVHGLAPPRQDGADRERGDHREERPRSTTRRHDVTSRALTAAVPAWRMSSSTTGGGSNRLRSSSGPTRIP